MVVSDELFKTKHGYVKKERSYTFHYSTLYCGYVL